MKFTIKAQQFAKGVDPAVSVATKQADKGYEHSFQITLNAQDEKLQALACNGKISIIVNIDDITIDGSEYSCDEEGKVTIRGGDLINSILSFDQKETLIVTADDNEFRITPKSSEKEYQALSIYREHVPVTKKSDKVFKSLKMDRKIFVDGVKRIFFAIGYEEMRAQYLHWVFRAKKNKVRFLTGTGARFAVLDVEGKNVVKMKGDQTTDIIFPKDPSIVVGDVLGKADGDTVEISQANDPDQIVVSCDFYTLFLVKFDPNASYINEDDILNRDNDFVLKTKISDWELPTKGVVATYNEDLKARKDYQRAEMTIDTAKNIVNLRTEGTMRSKRKVKVRDVAVITKDDDDDRSWICPVNYLEEVITHSSDSEDEISMELAGAMQPIIVRHPEHTNEVAGTKETFTIFFACVASLVTNE